MKLNKCAIYSGEFNKSVRTKVSDNILHKNENIIDITLYENDSLEIFEKELNLLNGKSSSLFNLKKNLFSIIISSFSVFVIMFALISSAIYEDILKKIIFESPFEWNINDSISILFVLLFFFGLLMVPSILDGESSQFKDIIKSWFNKDTRVLNRLENSITKLDRKIEINIFNSDLFDKEHWSWKFLVPILCSRFENINLYIRNDKKRVITNRLKSFDVTNIKVHRKVNDCEPFNNAKMLTSSQEKILLRLLLLSSTNIFSNNESKKFVSLELFEYCGRNFFENKNDKNELVSGFQIFLNRSFDDFKFLKQYNTSQIYFNDNVEYNNLEDEQRRLSYYLRNHIEECVSYFDNPISLIILYYYVKDIVLDEKRKILILEKLISSIVKKQQYDLINKFWFDVDGYMFDSSNIELFDKVNESIYRKLSINSLNDLIFLFERNGHFEQAILLAKYLYAINPQKYSIIISSLLERCGKYDLAFEALPLEFKSLNKEKPSPLEIKYLQRKAWLIVSQRRENEKEQGEKLVENLNKILFSHKEDNEPLDLWHYYNIKANYCEWNNRLDEAIINYQKCLSIPSLGSFEYGATFVNMAISFRLKFIQSNFTDKDLIEQSIKNGLIGLNLKNSVGDRDEMPVVLHNQALNILYKVVHDDTQNEDNIEKIILYTTEGLEILNITNSTKRAGIMMIENYIGYKLLLEEEKASNILEKYKENLININEHEKNQAMEIYNLFVKYKGFEKLDFN